MKALARIGLCTKLRTWEGPYCVLLCLSIQRHVPARHSLQNVTSRTPQPRAVSSCNTVRIVEAKSGWARRWCGCILTKAAQAHWIIQREALHPSEAALFVVTRGPSAPQPHSRSRHPLPAMHQHPSVLPSLYSALSSIHPRQNWCTYSPCSGLLQHRQRNLPLPKAKNLQTEFEQGFSQLQYSEVSTNHSVRSMVLGPVSVQTHDSYREFW